MVLISCDNLLVTPPMFPTFHIIFVIYVLYLQVVSFARQKKNQKKNQKKILKKNRLYSHTILQLPCVRWGAVVEPGDEVLLLDPAYETYGACVSLAGGTPVPSSPHPCSVLTTVPLIMHNDLIIYNGLIMYITEYQPFHHPIDSTASPLPYILNSQKGSVCSS